MTAWRNRIIDHGEEAPDQLLANPKNWRIHPKAQQDALSGVLDEVGWVQEVIVNKTTGHVVDGHLRVSLAISRQEPTIPVKYVELSPEEEALVLATLDPLAGMAATAKDALESLLADVQPGSDAVTALLEDVAKGAGLSTVTEGLTDPDAIPEAEPVAKRGDVWVCGDHRVMCGDSTDEGDVERLMVGEKPQLCVTDPPYGVEYDPAWRKEAADKGLIGFHPHALGDVANDNIVDWRDAWTLIPSDVLYVWHAGRHASEVQQGIEALGFEVRCQLIWLKPSFAINRGHYNWQHEPCWYAVRKGKAAAFIGSKNETTVWDIARPVAGEHGTQKPVECMERPIRNHSGDVLDPFLGSGTTMIAAERLGRRCYGMEIEPRYVDVAVKRWEEFTGRKAERGR